MERNGERNSFSNFSRSHKKLMNTFKTHFLLKTPSTTRSDEWIRAQNDWPKNTISAELPGTRAQVALNLARSVFAQHESKPGFSSPQNYSSDFNLPKLWIKFIQIWLKFSTKWKWITTRRRKAMSIGPQQVVVDGGCLVVVAVGFLILLSCRAFTCCSAT